MDIVIQKKESKFIGMKFREIVDIDSIDELLSFELQDEGEYKKLKRYKHLIQNEKHIIYHHSKNHNLGRVFSKNALSLQSFRRKIRWYLAHDKYTDIDMVNAYPTILLQLCKNNFKPKEYKHLQKYVENRNAILNKLKCDRAKAKMLFITLLHGGSIDRWRRDFNCENVDLSKVKPSFFSNEIKHLIKVFHKQNKHLAIDKSTSCLSIILQYYENMILEVVYDYLVDNEYIINNDCVLCFDGIMIPKPGDSGDSGDSGGNTKKHDNDLLQDLHNVVYAKTGFQIVFDYKKMTKPKFEIKKPVECKITTDEDEDKYDDCIDCITHGEIGCSRLCADHFKNIIKKVTLSGLKFYCYDHKSKLWLISTKSRVMNMFNRHLKRCYDFCNDYAKKMIADGLDTSKYRSDIEAIQYLCSKIKQHSFLSNVVSLSNDTLYEKDFILKLNSVPHLLPIKNNKTLNLKTLEVRDRRYTDYFTCSLDYDYNTSINDSINVFGRFVEDLLRDNHYYRYFHKLMGYNITGETCEQLLPFWWGQKGGNGKSLLVKLFSAVMGSTFSGVFPKELLIKNKNINTELYLFSSMYCRCVFLSETNEDDNLDFSEAKKYSGEDPVSCRGHYEDPVKYMPYFKINNPLNFLYKFNTSDSAFIRRILVLPFKYYFRTTTDYDFSKTDSYCRVLDKTKSKELHQHLDHVFMWLVEGAYKYYQEGLDDVPEIMIKAKKEYIEDNDAILTFINEMFEVYDPDNKDHFHLTSKNHKVMNKEFKIESQSMDRYFYYFMTENKGKYGYIIKKAFKKRMKAFGYEYKNIGDCWGYEGLRYKPTKDECEIVNSEGDEDDDSSIH